MLNFIPKSHLTISHRTIQTIKKSASYSPENTAQIHEDMSTAQDQGLTCCILHKNVFSICQTLCSIVIKGLVCAITK